MQTSTKISNNNSCDIKRTIIEAGETYLIWECRYGGGRPYYEINQRRRAAAFTVKKHGKITSEYPAREISPSDEAFGTWAWTYPTVEKAQAKASTITRHSTLDSIGLD